jgi:WD40 repeat protein
VSSHVFISYSREDLRYVQALVEHLTAAGIPVWLDKKIATGTRWDTVIKEQIDTAAAVIVIMSPAADESGWVTNEIHHAIEIQKPILPLLLDGKPFFTLTRIHHEDVTGGRMPGESFMNALLELQENPPATPPPVSGNSLRQRISRPSFLVVASIVVLLVVLAVVFQPWRGNQPGGQTTDPGGQTTDSASVDSDALIYTAGSAVECIAFSPDGNILATGGGNDRTIRLWNPATGKLLRPLIGDGITTAIAFSPDGSFVVPAGDLTMWAPTTGKKIRQLDGGGWGVAVSPDSKLLAVGDAFNTVTLWATDTGQLIRVTPLTGDEGTVVETVAFSPDGKMLAAGGHEGTIKLWDPKTGRHIRTLANVDGAYWLAFSPNGRLFAASGNGPVRSWNTATGAEVGKLGTEVTKAALSPDGKLLATAGKTDYSVRLWDSTTGELVDTFTGHANAVRAIAFSADGRLLATGGDDQTARVWLID